MGVLAFWFLGGRAAAVEAVYPIENASNWFARRVGVRLRALVLRYSLSAENRRLAAEVDALRLVRGEADRLRDENKRLRRMLDYPPAAEGKWMPAPVLSRGGAEGVRHVLRAGRGSADGVRIDAAVAAPDGLVGRVVETTPHTCTVRLITDPGSRVSCRVETGDPDHGAVFGIFSGGRARDALPETDGTLLYIVDPLRISHLKRDLVIPPRAEIITSGLGGIFPRGLTVGYLIDGTRADETQLEREGDVVPAVDFPALEDVFIRRED